MSECRALTNLVGNGVATVVVSRWEKEVSKEVLNRNMSQSKSMADYEAEEPSPQESAASTGGGNLH